MQASRSHPVSIQDFWTSCISTNLKKYRRNMSAALLIAFQLAENIKRYPIRDSAICNRNFQLLPSGRCTQGNRVWLRRWLSS